MVDILVYANDLVQKCRFITRFALFINKNKNMFNIFPSFSEKNILENYKTFLVVIIYKYYFQIFLKYILCGPFQLFHVCCYMT